ncbi:MAG: sulfotransferase [Pirellulales bacterium]|nr:sulfotransferase [Pirellulales bacterium]
MTLPTFLIIGVAKGGTTSLFRYLEQHPQVFMCAMKGTNYFGYEDARAWKWHDEGDPPLLRNFPVHTFQEYQAAFAGGTGAVAVGEASPQYIRCPTAARRIHECLPDVKLIVSLRNPAARAFSGFLMRMRRGERVGGIYEELTAASSHVRESFYYHRLKRYYDIFPREQIKVLIFEEFRQDAQGAVQELFEFIGVDPHFVADTSTRYNPASVPRNRLANRLFYNPHLIRAAKALLPLRVQEFAKRLRQQNLKAPPTLPPDLRERLLDLYRDDIAQLETLIDRDLSLWLQPAGPGNGHRPAEIAAAGTGKAAG